MSKTISMARILTGIQSTGVPHLGNILGAIIPAIKRSKTNNNDSFLFIADLHSLTQIKNAEELKKNTLSTAAAWLSFDLDTKKSVFYRQSDVPEVTELAWYLSCFYPYQRLTLSHSFKDKSQNLKDINAGLFNYPVLMAADILLYDANIVPVGKDQLQHLEITRNIASRFNNHFGDTFIIPKAELEETSSYVVGTDGNKMSKSKNNIINIFQDDNLLEKQVMKIKTESIAIDEPKNPNKCAVFKIFSLVADEKDAYLLKKRYTSGNIGFGEAKRILLDEIKNKFKIQRNKFNFLISNPLLIEEKLEAGSKKAKIFANKVLKRVRSKLGYSK